jgi:CzcA family heavy metal efflux pump
MAMVIAEFDWGRDIYLCRQIAQERLQLAQEKLPPGVTPVMAPAASVTGEVVRMALTSDGTVSPIELRTIADWDIKPRLLTVQGVAQIFTIGGGAKEYQILANPIHMARYGVAMDELEVAVTGANKNTPGGFIYREGNELIVRNIGRPEEATDLELLVVKTGTHGSVYLRDVATVKVGQKIPRGAAGLNDQDAVIVNVLKQPEANTLKLTALLEEEIESIKKTLPAGVTLHDGVYRQARFIETAIHNVIEAVRDGGILVVIILVLFLMSLRMSLIILTAIPLSIVTTLIVFEWFGLTINTMTLGGLAVAIGELVDSAIVGAENIYRRLRENIARPREERKHFLPVIADATAEVFSAIILGTVIVLLVVLPLFALPGFVGSIFGPIGVAYLVSIFASMVVSITVTPVLASFLLGGRLPEYGKDGFVVRILKRAIEPLVLFSVRVPSLVLGVGAIVALWAVWQATRLGVDLLPEFNEGSIFIITMTPPGTSLSESNNLSRAAAMAVQRVPEIGMSQTGRRAGRSEGDEHAHSINTSDIEAELVSLEGGRSRPIEEIHHDVRDALKEVPGVVTEVGQPIQHLISHLIGGARSQIIIKIFGPNLTELQRIGTEVHETIREIEGIVDDYVEQQVLIPQLRIVPNDFELSRYGLKMADVLHTMETALQGETVSQVLSGERYFDLVIRGEDALREHPETIGNLLLTTSNGAMVPLKAVADIVEDLGPNMINHENARRRLFVLCNTEGRDLGGAVSEIRRTIEEKIEFPKGYSWAIGGQYDQLIESGRTMTVLFALALLFMVILLAADFRSLSLAAIVMLNIPQAVIGAVIALLVTGTTLNMGALVGFIALCGIAARNGILLISHWATLIREEGEEFTPAMILRGCKERLTPVLMTALTTNLGLIPLVLAKGQPGKEILYPVAVVIFGGLCTSTLLDFTVTPAAAVAYGKKGILRLARVGGREMDDEHLLEEESLEIEGSFAK